MDVSVVIPCYNSERTIEGCLGALLNQNYRNYEIIVVDDGSTDKTSEIVKKFISKRVKYVYQHNQGPAAARNHGWKEARGRYILFTDSDCFPRKNWITEMIKPFKDKRVGAVGGTYETLNKDKRIAEWVGLEIEYRHNQMPRFIDFAGSYSLAVRKEVLEEVGGFDTRFRRASGEDNDLCYRIRERGYLIYFNRKAVVGHFHPDSLLKYLKSQMIHAYWRVYLYKKHPNMFKGDRYTGASTHLQGPLYLLMWISGILSIFLYWILPIFLILLTLSVIIHIPFTVWAVRKTRKISDIGILGFSFLRSSAWALGMIGGMRFISF